MQSYPLPIHFENVEEKHEINSIALNTFVEPRSVIRTVTVSR